MPFIPTEYLEEQILVNATAVTPSPGLAGILTGAKIQPYVAPIAPTGKTILADLTVNVDANMDPVAITWGAQYRRPTGGVAIDGALKQFQLADAVNACNVYGIALLNAAADKLLGCYPIQGGYGLADVLDALNVSPQVAIGGPDFGDLTVSS